jgi:hypothetical protein
MTSNEAMIIGERIAALHKKNVLEMIEMGATPERALHGCLVSLAACVMVELQKAATPLSSGIRESKP